MKKEPLGFMDTVLAVQVAIISTYGLASLLGLVG